MLFNSATFIIGFLPTALVGFLLVGHFFGNWAARLWLLMANMLFYAWWNIAFLALLAGSITVNFGFWSLIRDSTNSRKWLVAGIVLNLGVLVFFKYTNFLADLLAITLPFSGMVLPLGISFFTFQQIMFLVDTYRREVTVNSFLDYACFISFFPHLIAGPLVRPDSIIPQFANLRPMLNLRWRLSEGLEIFLLGLAKKIVLADSLARFSDTGFAAAARHDPISLVEAWVSLLSYSLQIYFDFSGYSDMAIGLALMFGIYFPANFNSPYQAKDISEFWQRWNITLSRFLRDYLYIPLGGNRRGEKLRIFNVMATMLLGGLWHGAATKFILWGALHGSFIVVHGLFKRTRLRLPPLASQILTISLVLLAWVPFRAADFPATIDIYKGLFGLNGFFLPEIFIRQLPILEHICRGVPVLPYLGDARTMSLPQGLFLLLIGWTIVLLLPNSQHLSRKGRSVAIISSFAFTVQALFFAPFSVPFLYFQF
jgi:D-alanyl-lipoteichoic acid acyltransferase DltB (MBOAT superfamily)